jgi:hypothetical protein
MPTGALHSHFWMDQGPPPDPPDPPTSGAQVSYPAWQMTVTFGSGFGALQALYDRWAPSRTTTQRVE